MEKTFGDVLGAAIHKQEVETMSGLGISPRTIRVLEQNAVDVNRLCEWHSEGRKALKRHVRLLNGIGPVRMREVVKAIARGRSRLVWGGLMPHLATEVRTIRKEE